MKIKRLPYGYGHLAAADGCLKINNGKTITEKDLLGYHTNTVGVKKRAHMIKK